MTHLMKDKHIIVIGGGSYRLRNIWSDANNYGIKITLVEQDPNHIGSKHVYSFIKYNFSNHKKDHVHASEIIRMIHSKGIKADGCLSFCNEYTPFVALICEKLKLRGVTYSATVKANSKSFTQNVLRMSTADGETFQTSKFVSQAVHLTSESDCEKLPESFKFPAILKLDNCSGAVGACMVRSQRHMKEQFQKITASLRTDSDFPGIGLRRGNSMTSNEYYVGTEHIVDVVLYDKKLIYAFITDCGVLREPYYIATARRMPTFLQEDQRNKMIDAALKCCLAIGLTDGLFNIDFIMTANGPKLLEINPRMGGYVFRDWLQKLYGIDIMIYAMMIASGIKPEIVDLAAGKMLMGVMVIPSLHGKLLKDPDLKSKLEQMIESGQVFFLQFLDNVENSFAHEKPFGNIAVSGTSSIETKKRLMKVCTALDIDQEGYKVEEFIQNF